MEIVMKTKTQEPQNCKILSTWTVDPSVMSNLIFSAEWPIRLCLDSFQPQKAGASRRRRPQLPLPRDAGLKRP